MKLLIRVHIQASELLDIKAGRPTPAVLPVTLVAVLIGAEGPVRLLGAPELCLRAGPATAFLAADAEVLRLRLGLGGRGREDRSGSSGGRRWAT